MERYIWRLMLKMKKGVKKAAVVCMTGAIALGNSVMPVGAMSIPLISYSELLEDDVTVINPDDTTSKTENGEENKESEQSGAVGTEDTDASVTQTTKETEAVETDTTVQTGSESDLTSGTDTVVSDTQQSDTPVSDTNASSDDTYIDTTTESTVKAPLDPQFNNIAVAYINEGSYVNIRDEASLDGNVIGKIYNNCGADILGEEGDWYYIQSGSVTGYVNKAYFVTGADAEYLSYFIADEVATVNTETLMVREEADGESDIISMVGDSQELEVLGQEGDWVKVAVDADLIGYVSSDYVNCETVFPAAESIEEEQIRLAEEEAARQAAEEAYAQYLAEQEAAYAQYLAEQEAAYQAAIAQQQAEQAQAEAEYAAYLAEQQAAYEAAIAQQEAEQAEAEAQYQQYLAEIAYLESLQQDPSLETEAPIYEDPVYEDPGYEDPIYEDPGYEDPIYEDPGYEDPIYEDPGYEDPIYEDPGYEDPIYEDPGTSSIGDQIVAYALQFVGNPYVWGGTSLTDGADCSGFTQSVFAAFGIYIPRTAAEQAGSGTPVDLGSLQPGDLIFYSDGGTIGHVSIYIGNGQVVHASSPSTGIIVSDRSYRSEYSAVRYY